VPRGDSPHDKLIKEAFGSPEAMRGLLASILPDPLVRQLDLATLAPVPGSFLDEELSSSYSDLLFAVSLSSRSALVYVLVEHKSRSDRWVLLQLLRYIVRIWDRFLRDHPRADRLPPIVPVVVCHDPSGWSAPHRFGDLLDPLASDLPDLARLTPHFEAVIDDLNQSTDAELLQRAMGAFATLGAIFLRDARTPGRVLPMIHNVARLLTDLLHTPDGPRAVTLLLRYLSHVADTDVTDLTHVLQRTVPEANELIMTIAEQLRQQGLQQGLQQGRLATLRKQLEQRFGRLDRGVVARLEAADDAALDRLTERVLTAASLDEAFAE
jgi:predicted transposase YdaD